MGSAFVGSASLSWEVGPVLFVFAHLLPRRLFKLVASFSSHLNDIEIVVAAISANAVAVPPHDLGDSRSLTRRRIVGTRKLGRLSFGVRRSRATIRESPREVDEEHGVRRHPEPTLPAGRSSRPSG